MWGYKAFHESEHVNRRRGNRCSHSTLDASRLPDLTSHSSSFNIITCQNIKLNARGCYSCSSDTLLYVKTLVQTVQTSPLQPKIQICAWNYKIHSFLQKLRYVNTHETSFTLRVGAPKSSGKRVALKCYETVRWHARRNIYSIYINSCHASKRKIITLRMKRF